MLRDFLHTIYGLGIRSSTPIPGLAPSAGHSSADLVIRLGSVPQRLAGAQSHLRPPSFISPYRDEQGEPISRLWRLAGGAYFRLRYWDGTEFVINRSGTRVWAAWSPDSTLEDTATYLLGPVLGLVLALRGTYCLHASVIAVEGKAVALLGPPGAGKSTTAAAFARRGYPVLSEDLAALLHQDGRYLIPPGYPCIRLWDASVESLYGSPKALPCCTPTWDKRQLDLSKNGYRFQTTPLPLAAIYHLAPRSADPAAPRVELTSGQEKMLSLVGNMHSTYMLGAAFQARAFAMLQQLQQRVPVRRVIPHADPGRLPELCDAILDDLRALPMPVEK
jgi:hypothetical protein